MLVVVVVVVFLSKLVRCLCFGLSKAVWEIYVSAQVERMGIQKETSNSNNNKSQVPRCYTSIKSWYILETVYPTMNTLTPPA